MLLSDEQLRAAKKIFNFLESPNCSKKFFLLSGNAGTGKTYTVGRILELTKEWWIKETYNEEVNDFQDIVTKTISVAVTAPTNKAVKVLRQTLDFSCLKKIETISKVECATIFKVLGLNLEYDNHGGQVLVEGENSTIDDYDLVIIDEASMISSELWALIKVAAARNYRSKFLLLGDNAQLNPVNEDFSPVFKEGEIKDTFNLTEIQRTEYDNPVMQAITEARNKVLENNKRIKQIDYVSEDKRKGVFFQSKAHWLHHMTNAFKSERYQLDPNFVRAIAWRNKTVNSLNDYIREALYPTADLPYVEGERLIASEAIFDPIDQTDVLIYTSSELIVEEAKMSRCKDYGYNLWLLTVQDEEKTTYHLKVIDSSSKDDFATQLRRLAREAREANRIYSEKEARGIIEFYSNPWEKYWKHKKSYAAVNYAYALTSHKAQGSTFDNVFVAKKDIYANRNIPERNRSLYVSFSRAKERLFVNV